MKDIIYQQLEQHGLIFQKFISDEHQIQQIELAASCMIDTLKQGGKILACGNGGSMSDAMHFVSELVGKYRQPRPAYAAMALSDQGTITCISNDFGYSEVFRRQVEALGRHRDTLLVLSTSGESHNVVRAAHFARSIGMKVVAITGAGGGQLRHNAEVLIQIPHSGTADRIQELTIIIIHILVSLIENNTNEEHIILRYLKIGDRFSNKKGDGLWEVVSDKCNFNSSVGSATRECKNLLTGLIDYKLCKIEVIKK